MGIKMGTPPQQQPSDANLTIQNASFSGVSFDISGQDSRPEDLFFTANGTRMFVIGNNSNSVLQYTLNNGFDLSTASFDNISFDVSGQETFPAGIFFNSTGTRMFIAGTGSDSVHQYTLGTGFDLSTASFDNVSFSVLPQENGSRGISFNGDGTRMFIVGVGSDSVHQYTLGTGFDLSTASFDNVSFDVSGQDGFPAGISFNSTGTKMFMVGFDIDSVYEYDL